MATRLTKIIADFQTSLATILAVGATSATLVSATDDDLVALPAGAYFFTIDGDNTNKEHIVCDLSGTSISNIKSVSRQGVQASGCVRVHRVGAQVILTDWAALKEITNLLDGTIALDGAHPLIYDTDPVITDLKHLATKKYIDVVALAGASVATASALGILKLSCAPVDPLIPIAVGDNDPRLPTTGQKAALVGTGTPGAGNKYVTETDANLTNNVKTTGDQTVAGVKTFSSLPLLGADPSGNNDAVRKSYVDGLAVVSTGNLVLDGSHTLYYSRIAKTYFNFYMQSGNDKYFIVNDSNTVNKICALLSKTLSSSVALTMHFNGQNGYSNGNYATGWTGSAWSYNADINIANTGTFTALFSITVA